MRLFHSGSDKPLGFVAAVEFLGSLITAAQEKCCSVDMFKK
jgi:threonine/homoserine efflux transporter RhtA